MDTSVCIFQSVHAESVYVQDCLYLLFLTVFLWINNLVMTFLLSENVLLVFWVLT